MIAYQYQAENYTTGIPLPGASVSVYNRGTVTPSSLYNLSGGAISNPMIADVNGIVIFQVTGEMLYDIQCQSGIYVSPRLMLEDIAVIAGFAQIVAGLQNQVTAMETGTFTGPQAPHAVLAGPSTGTSAAPPSYRPLTVTDLPASILGGLTGLGVWNASTNTPTLASSVGTQATYYLVSVSGTTTLNGISSWAVGDFAVFLGGSWFKVASFGAVTSVAGRTGAVVLTVSDVSGAVTQTNFAGHTSTPNLQFYGGLDDGTTVNDSALAAAVAALPVGSDIRLPYVTSGIYLFSTSMDWGTLVVDADENVVIRSTLFPAPGDFLTRRDIKWQFGVPASTAYYAFTIAANITIPERQKSYWIESGEVDRSTTTAIDATTSTLTHVTLAFPGSDTTVAATPASTTADTVNWNLTPDAKFHLSILTPTFGDRLTCYFPTVSSLYFGAAVIFFTNGWHLLFFSSTGALNLTRKLVGSAATSNSVATPNSGYDTYNPALSQIEITVLDATRYTLSINTVPIVGVPISAGAGFGTIKSIGFGAECSSSTISVPVSGWTKRTRIKYGLSNQYQILVVGDSISAPTLDGNWTSYCAEAINGSLGQRVIGFKNLAITGQGAAQQYSNLVANGGAAGTSAAVVFIGTNDIQALTTIGAIGTGGSFVDSLNNIFTNIQATLFNVVCVIPPLFYPRSLTPGGNLGANALNYGAGTPYRIAIMRLCAALNIPVVDSTEILGPAVSSFLSGIYDPVLRDNIHPTGFASRILGHAIGQAVMRGAAPRPDDVSLLGAVHLSGDTMIGPLGLQSATVAGLASITPTVGLKMYASNGRMFNGTGTLEGAGVGTGGEVTGNGTAWKITGTNVTVSA